jgi:dihydrofolate reductase
MRTTVYIGTSLDGFIAEKNRTIDWLTEFESAEIGDSYKEFIRTIDAIVIGRRTFETVIAFPSWPYTTKVFLLSKTIKQVPDALREKVTLLSMEPKEILRYLSSQGYSHVYVDGGNVVQSFLREDCIDELIITKVPLLLGSGIPLFGILDHRLRFNHIKTTVYSNGLVKSRYERLRE